MSGQKWVPYVAGGFGTLVAISFLGGEPEVLPGTTVEGFVDGIVKGPFRAIDADGTLINFDDRDFGDPPPDILTHRCISTTDRRSGVRSAIPRDFACYAQLDYEGEALLLVFGAQRYFDLEGRESISATSLHEDVMNDYRARFDFPEPGEVATGQ
jgi:hypothetical protein